MPKHSIQFEAIGTGWSIETATELPGSLKNEIHDRIQQFDTVFSRFKKDSLVAQIAGTPGTYQFPDDASILFDFYDTLYAITNGKVTPFIGSMLERAGYDADYSFVETQQQALPDWNKAVQRQRALVTVNAAVMIDVGAAGKGFLVDCIGQLLETAGITEYVIDASGDLRHRGAIDNRVGLEDPFDTSRVIGVVDVKNKSLCASATNRRQWGDGRHHIFDPHTMRPTEGVVATWVIADSTMVADGIATSLFFSDPKMLRRYFDFEFVRMYSSGAIDYSPTFEGLLL